MNTIMQITRPEMSVPLRRAPSRVVATTAPFRVAMPITSALPIVTPRFMRETRHRDERQRNLQTTINRCALWLRGVSVRAGCMTPHSRYRRGNRKIHTKSTKCQ